MTSSFAIIGHARSGSSSLKRLLELHRDITMEGEPFNPERHLWEYPFDYQGIIDQDGFDGCLDYLFQKFNGIKHLYEHLEQKHNEQLIDYVDKVVFLYRRNRLRAAVSLLLSQQSQHWGAGKHPGDIKWQPLNLDDVEYILHQFGRFQRHLGRYHNVDHIVVEHDSLYGNSSVEDKLACMNRILQFLGRDPITNHRLLGECAKILDHSNKTSGKDIYQQIPNISEVEQRFSNESNGHLF